LLPALPVLAIMRLVIGGLPSEGNAFVHWESNSTLKKHKSIFELIKMELSYKIPNHHWK
jgi:hypothetical protein